MSKSDDMRKLIDLANNNRLVSETYVTESDNESSPFKAFASWGNSDFEIKQEMRESDYYDPAHGTVEPKHVDATKPEGTLRRMYVKSKDTSPVKLEEATTREEAIETIKKLQNTTGRSPAEIETVKKITDKLMQQWKLSPSDFSKTAQGPQTPSEQQGVGYGTWGDSKTYKDAINRAVSTHSNLSVSDADIAKHLDNDPSYGNVRNLKIPATHNTTGEKHTIHAQIYNQGGRRPYELVDTHHEIKESVKLEEANTREEAIATIKKLLNTAGRSPAEIETIKKVTANLMRQWKISPEDLREPNRGSQTPPPPGGNQYTPPPPPRGTGTEHIDKMVKDAEARLMGNAPGYAWKPSQPQYKTGPSATPHIDKLVQDAEARLMGNAGAGYSWKKP